MPGTNLNGLVEVVKDSKGSGRVPKHYLSVKGSITSFVLPASV